MYMSYCRNEGTYHEITACIDAVQEIIDSDGTDRSTMSGREAHYFVEIIRAVQGFLIENELLDEFGDLNEEKLDGLQSYLEGKD